MLSVSSAVLAALAIAIAPVLAVPEHADSISTVASVSSRLRVLFEPEQLPCHIAGVAACVDVLQKNFFACDPRDIDCQCGALIELELSCYGICPKSDLLLEVATTINEICSKPGVSSQYDQEPEFLEDDDEEIVVDFDDGGSLVIENNATDEAALEFDDEIQEDDVADDLGDDEPLVVDDSAAEEPATGDEVTDADESAIAEGSDTTEEIALAEESDTTEEIDLAEESEISEESAVAEVPAADDESAAEENVAEEPAASIPASVWDDSVPADDGEPMGLYDASEDTTYGVAASEQVNTYIPYFATATPVTAAAPAAESTYVPVAVPQPAALSPTATPVAEDRSPSEVFNAVAAASITSIPVFVPVHTVMADTDNTVTVTFPRFQGFSPAAVTPTTSGGVAPTVVPMALDVNSTVEDSDATSTNSRESGLYNSSSSAIDNYAYNSSGSGRQLNESGYGDLSGNQSYNTTDTIFDSSSHNIGVTATIVVGAAIGVAFALF
ncbi:hypothetical protein V1525DRAFT_404514 [Lipomyces kononenkoae]|uniref:Uncharacterized protein n=1 Tax=Lipomyces kononenkoae TaxID=34357 RepID=A0ACC3SZX1_LIPKO